jgi:hypothetical protein
MTQILLHQSERGIVLATDSRAVAFLPGEQKTYIEIQKIFRLSLRVILVTGGAGYGMLLCQELRSHIELSGLTDFDEIKEFATLYLPKQMEKIHRERGCDADRLELQRVYFLLAGHAPQTSQNPFRFELWGSEHCNDPLHIINTGSAVAIPRQMGIEHRLSNVPASENEMEEAEKLCESFLIKRAGESNEVGPPFYFARITATGISIRNLERSSKNNAR